MESKPAYLSKTVLVNSLIAICGVISGLGFLPSVDEFVKSNSNLILMALGIIGIGLRFVTKGKIDLGD